MNEYGIKGIDHSLLTMLPREKGNCRSTVKVRYFLPAAGAALNESMVGESAAALDGWDSQGTGRTFYGEETRETDKLNETIFARVLELVYLDFPESLDVGRNIAVLDMPCLGSNQRVRIARKKLERGKGKSGDSNSHDTGLRCLATYYGLSASLQRHVSTLTTRPKPQQRNQGREDYPR